MIYKDDRAVAPISATVREQINGEYALDATFAEDVVTEEDVLRASTPYGQQLFRVREVERHLDGTVSVYAPHIFYDLSDYFIEDSFPTAKTAQEALEIILNAATESHGFTATSDITTLNNARYVYRSVAEAIMQVKEDNAVLNRWGGEIERDDYEIRLLQRKGADRGISIRYRKNLTGLIARADLTDVKTRIYPTGLNENDTVLEIASKYIDSPLINDYAHPKVGRAHFSDVKVDPDGEYPTVAAARSELVARANALYAAGADLPRLTLDVQFVDLSKTVEYAQYSQLEQVFLGDTVHVAYEPLGVDVSLRVVEYEWDSCADRYLALVVGDVAPKITDSVISTTIDISVLRDTMTDALKQGEKYNHVYINHDEGFVAQAEINGQDVKVMMNATDGLMVYIDGEKSGGLMAIDGQVRMVARTLADPEGGDRSYVSLEKDPDQNWLDSMRFFVEDGTGWNEHLRIAYGAPFLTRIRRFATSTSIGVLELSGASKTGAGIVSSVRVCGGDGGWIACTVRGGTDEYETNLSTTGFEIRKNGNVLESWS